MTIVLKRTLGSRLAAGLHRRARHFPPYQAWLHHGHRKARAAHQNRVSNNGKLDDLYQELRTYGVAQRHIRYFGVPYEAMLLAADRLCAELAAQPAEGIHYQDIMDDERVVAEPSRISLPFPSQFSIWSSGTWACPCATSGWR